MRGQTEQSYKERILRVLIHIQSHLDETISLDDLARIAHFSPFHFHRIFRGMVGESVKEHVRRLRLERAAHRLKFSDLPVTCIAFEAGYETHEAFTRAFGSMFGEAPTQFRQTHRAVPLPAVASGVHFFLDGQVVDFQASQSGGPQISVSVQVVPVMHIAFMRHAGPYEEVGQTWGRLFSWAGPRGLVGPRTQIVGVVHDDPEMTPPDRTRYDAGLIVNENFKPAGEIGVQDIGGGEFAVAGHRGPYNRLGETYASLCGQWLPAAGREARSAPALEIYRNSPQDTPPQDLFTEIYLPLEPVR